MSGTIRALNTTEWAAIQTASFLERLDLLNGRDLQNQLEQLDNIYICREIIRCLATENCALKTKNRLETVCRRSVYE